MSTIFNKGEAAIQEKLGVRQIAENIGRSFSNEIVKGAIPFIENQTLVIVSSVDLEGKVWTSVLLGEPGFVKVASQDELYFDLTKVYSDKEDVFYTNIGLHPQIGCLFIELSTRRRYRINGKTELVGEKVQLKVLEAYPNCPKYIQQRTQKQPENLKAIPTIKKEGKVLTGVLKHWILNADTLFVGSSGLDGRMDASHRGGPIGFVELLNGNTLKVPDYRGNNLYNTFGNFTENPKGGVLFIDFEQNKTLQLTGSSKIVTDLNSKEELAKSGGTGRFWFFTIESYKETQNHHSADWDFISSSKYNPEY